MRRRIDLVFALQRQGCVLSPCGLQLPTDSSLMAWEAVGHSLGKVQQSTLWWIGDWWCAGHRYGERTAIVTSTSWWGPSLQTCMNTATVCRAFETSRRRQNLTFSHHAVVASRSRAEQDALLNWCEQTLTQNGKPRSVRELRDELERRRTARMPARVSAAANRDPQVIRLMPPARSDDDEQPVQLDVPWRESTAKASPNIRSEPEVLQRMGSAVKLVASSAPEVADDAAATSCVVEAIRVSLQMRAISGEMRKRLMACLQALRCGRDEGLDALELAEAQIRMLISRSMTTGLKKDLTRTADEMRSVLVRAERPPARSFR